MQRLITHDKELMYLFSGCVGVGVGLLISDCPIFRYGRTCYLKIECVCVWGEGGGGRRRSFSVRFNVYPVNSQSDQCLCKALCVRNVFKRTANSLISLRECTDCSSLCTHAILIEIIKLHCAIIHR